MATFIFDEDKDKYYLTDSLGNKFWKAWPKKKVELENAIKEADRHVGEYIRDFQPHTVRYKIEDRVGDYDPDEQD